MCVEIGIYLNKLFYMKMSIDFLYLIFLCYCSDFLLFLVFLDINK